MSTVVVDTSGGSKFKAGSDLFGGAGDITRKALASFGLDVSLNLTDDDNQPVLKSTKTVIDVVNDFSWYAGPKATTEALNKVPCVFLTEREQLLSSLITGSLMYLNAGKKGIQALANSSGIKSLLGKVAESVDSGLSNIQFANQGDRKLLEVHNLKSLEGIYFTRETDFKYRLPMYGSPGGVSNDWADSSSSDSIVSKITQGIASIGNTLSEIVNIGQPGVYIEKPLYFQGATQGKTETVTFPLTNTVRRGTHSPIQQNYELLWLLAFQNKPYKTSFARTPPPKIYTVQVPGQFSMPYAYISDMTVEFLGTTRKTKVFVQNGNGEGNISSKQITTPVPDAYQVSISFTSLIGDYGNSMISNAFSTLIDGNKVKIGQ